MNSPCKYDAVPKQNLQIKFFSVPHIIHYFINRHLDKQAIFEVYTPFLVSHPLKCPTIEQEIISLTTNFRGSSGNFTSPKVSKTNFAYKTSRAQRGMFLVIIFSFPKKLMYSVHNFIVWHRTPSITMREFFSLKLNGH